MATEKSALITGITGQDGSYLAEFLIEKGYEVHGLVRRSSVKNTARISAIAKKLHLHDGDVTDAPALCRLLADVRPSEIYHLAAQSHVGTSFVAPIYTHQVNAMGTINLLEAVKVAGLESSAKFYQASTSELFGVTKEDRLDESSPFAPASPYGISKQTAYQSVCHAREAYGLFAVNGILFNHESERRGENFVTRKISLAAGRIAEGLQEVLELGNLNGKRDWGYAPDYTEGMWKMLQQDAPEDFVLATGTRHTVREFATGVFAENGIEIVWKGKGQEEVGLDRENGACRIRVNPEFFRPIDVDNLCGNPARAIEKLRWDPKKTTITDLIKTMATHDRKLAKNEKANQ